MALAIILFLIAAYAVFLLAHVPQARPAANLGRLAVAQTEQLTLLDPQPGEFMTATLRGTGMLSVSAEPGSMLREPSADLLQLLKDNAEGYEPPQPGGDIDLRIANSAASLATVTISIKPLNITRLGVRIRPIVQHDETGFEIRSDNARLSAEILWTTEPPQENDTGPLLLGATGALPIARAVLDIPPGKRLYVGSPTTGEVKADFGARADRGSRGGLPVAAAIITDDSQGTSDARRLACGAPEPRALSWPGFGGGIDVGSCKRTLQVVGMKIDNPLSFELSGPAFVGDEQGLHYWQLLEGIASNPVLQTALTLIVGAFLAWIAMRLRSEPE